MKANELVRLLVWVLTVSGLLMGLYIWLHNLLEDLQTKLTGIWTNGSNTFRVLIYRIDSVMKGDVIWADPNNQSIMGKSILENVRLRFLFGKGHYTCPFTNKKYEFRLRFISKDSLQLYLTDTSGKMVTHETWSLVK